MPSYPDLHLPPTIAAAVERLGWASDDPALRDAAPTAARGHNLVVVAPPAPAYAVPALAGMMAGLASERRALLLCADAQLEEWSALAAALGSGTVSVQMARTSARAARRLKAAEVQVIVTSPATAADLQRRSALELDQVGAVFLAYPESWDDADALAPLMQDLGKDTQRIICTSSPERTADLTERYARRALVVGGPAADAAAPAPQGPVRTVGVSWARRVAVLAELLEVLDPSSAVVWTADRSRHDDIARALPPGDSSVRVVTGEPPKASVAIAFDLPTPAMLGRLLEAGEVVLLTPPGTESYVERLATPRRPVRLPGAAEAVLAEAATRRSAIASAIEEHPADAAMLTLAPLFERYDAAAVAAALYGLWTSKPIPVAATAPGAPAGPASTAKIFVGIGKKDGATVNDLVAVLTKEVRLDRANIGRVELRDAFMLVEVPSADAERVAAALTGVTIRRKRISARVDRGPTKPARASRPSRRA